MNLTEALTQIRYDLLEEYPGYWTDEELIDYLNQGNAFFHSQRGIPSIWTIHVDDGTTIVERNDNMINIKSLLYKKDGETSYSDAPSNTITTQYIEFKDALAAGTLKWYGERVPKKVSVGTDIVEVAPGYEQAIIDFAIYRAMIKDNDPRSSAFYANFMNAKMRWENRKFKPSHKIKCTKGW